MRRIRFLTAGESHGKGLVVIIEGIPYGLPISRGDIKRELKRRREVYGRSERMKIEEDEPEILSGVRFGKTIGSPISVLIRNVEWEKWKDIMREEEGEWERLKTPRPGHADYAGVIKYGTGDIRPIMERASARETVMRVVAGAFAKKFLREFGIEIKSRTLSIGGIWAEGGWDVEGSPLRCPDKDAEKKMKELIDRAREEGDTLGGVFEVVAKGVPPGLGSHIQWDLRLDSRIAGAIMSINAVKAVEIGEGIKIAGMKGSESHDEFYVSQGKVRRKTNRAGGIEGGISNGEEIIVRAYVKPVPTLRKPLKSIDLDEGKEVEAFYERSDICIVPAACTIGEAMLSLVIADAFLEKFGGDSMDEVRRNYKTYIEGIKWWSSDFTATG